MPTWRRFAHRAFHCALYEAQDVLADAGNVDLVEVEPAAGFATRERWLSRLVFRDVSHRLVLANPGLKPVRLTEDYDLFLAVCQSYEELLYLNAIENWKDRCRTSACWVDELWAASIPKYRHWLEAFKRFDHVFVASLGSVEPLSRALDRPVHWLPNAVDARRFTPFPQRPERNVDVYSIGRRAPAVHTALAKLAADGELFYIRDTFVASQIRVLDHREHRETFAGIAKRSRFFAVAPAKLDEPSQTVGQTEVGYRYFEGVAAGAVLLGQRPRCESFDRLFDWPDSVVDINPDGSDTVAVVRGLLADPETATQISERNAAEALVRHDWAHRWTRLLDVAGVPVPDALLARQREMARLAGRTENAVACTGRFEAAVCAE